ncbi:MAG: hypothetical protein M3P06_24385 [Acidobacteriota bacterium]|nr:hypothetical protein [Acidobacteriota bacterium]
MNNLLLLAAALLCLLGVAHSYLGERYILIRLFRRNDLPALLGNDAFTKQTLRFAWHVTTVLAFGFAAILLVLASPDREGGRNIATIISATCALCGIVAFIGSRGRHLSWIAFFAIAALTWFGRS